MNGFVTFIKKLKYLGSYISYNLKDDFDIEAHIMSATNEIGYLKNFWDNIHVDTYSKYLIFQDITMNIILWGCEAWYLCTTLKNMPELFFIAPIKTDIENFFVPGKNDYIRRADIQERIYNIISVEKTVAARNLLLLEKLFDIYRLIGQQK